MSNPLLRDLSSWKDDPVGPEYRPFQFTIADLLALMVLAALLLGTCRFPASFSHVIPLLAVLYVVKYRIVTFHVQPWLALLLYLAASLALLLYHYFCIVDVWNYGHHDTMARWVGVPIVIFTFPTASFLWDIFRRAPSFSTYALRSVIEIVFIMPVWAVLWFFAMIIMAWLDFPQPK